MSGPAAAPRRTGSELRRVFRQAATYGLGSAANRLVGLLLIPVYTRAIDPTRMGVLEVVQVTGGVLSVVLGLGFSSALIRQHVSADDDSERDRALATMVLTLALAAAVVTALGILFAPALTTGLGLAVEEARLVRIMLAGVFVEVGLYAPFAWLRKPR